MRFLLVSDIHKSYEFYRGYDESVAVEWLLEIIDETKPQVLISAGDWDEGMTSEDFGRILSKVKLLTVYGNHENFPIIQRYAIPNGKVFEFGGLKIAGINGLVGDNNIKGIPITTPTQFMNAIYRIKKYVPKLDILVTHQPPYIPEIYPKMRPDNYNELVFEAVEDLKPRLFFNGHMTAGCYSSYKFPSGTKYLRVDSSQIYKCYGLLESEVNEVRVYNEDNEEVFSLTF
ncbi:metallophosphoesterase [Sulfolobus sp. A20]|uniref:metallophosphoesterase family protein n=2 Tax=Sulfolobaceae TaxID=118883 RepID=UPI000845CC2D|nr:metallophosphoesterase [Sulfolobus sp. A20]TRM75708.1 metallophosphoesterase [Sulfolobus sp. A20-N-F8]TRM77125.1 metallophosphoesterase [Sulfolobus sp. B5]TRM81358.1 metallophosphoesterase [Sulfolobus sp. D5]TRM83784.1 metallophosphoesterase [Sulfolobus sp. F3]TRM87176.1 metallophosphoesterase [Sulfolobus sp. C3]TRN03009.1 metallophosphoesterase [Sulfolobus sp. F1]